MFFLRVAFWLSLVVAFIPVNPEDVDSDFQKVTTMETVGVARTLIGDIASICERNPETCETGREVVSQMGLKAKEGARIVYNYLDDDSEDIKPTDKVVTGSVQSN